MTATDVRDRARSLADLPNSLVISSTDENNSLNESYHDVYQFITANDDDYYITEIVIMLQASYQSPTNQAASEWWVPLPSDFMSLRYLDFNNNGQWLSIYKAPLSSRNIGPSEAQYRIRGAYLWILGGFVLSAGSQLRLGYYPTPQQITLPLIPYQFGTSYTGNSFQTITEATYTSLNQTMAYVVSGTTVFSESILLNTVISPVQIYSAASTITEMQYYKGNLYMLFGGYIWKGAGTLQATIVMATLTAATLTATDFAIYKDVLYACTSTSVVSYTTSATLISTLAVGLNGPINPTIIFASGNIYIQDAANVIRQITNPMASVATNIIDCASDGTYLYLIDTNNGLYRATMTNATIGTYSTLSTDIKYVYVPEQSITTPASSLDQVYLPVLTRETPKLLAIGSQPPFNFNYPNNLFTELISYQMAVDFRVKAGQDPAMLVGRLGSRDVTNQMTGLWLRMYQNLKRDDYNPERIANRYSEQYSGIW